MYNKDKRYRRFPRTAAAYTKALVNTTQLQLTMPVKRMKFRWRGVITYPAAAADRLTTGTFNINAINDALGTTINQGTFLNHAHQPRGHEEALLNGFTVARPTASFFTFEFWNPLAADGATMLFYWYFTHIVTEVLADPADDTAGLLLVDRLKLSPAIQTRRISYFAGSHEMGSPHKITIPVPSNFALTKLMFAGRPPGLLVDSGTELDRSSTNVISVRDLTSPLSDASASDTTVQKNIFIQWGICRETGRAIDAAAQNVYNMVIDITKNVVVTRDTSGQKSTTQPILGS